MTTQPRTSGFVARFSTCFCVALVMVGVPLAFLWPEHARTAMTYAGIGYGMLLFGAVQNRRLGSRGLFLGMLLAVPVAFLGYWFQRSTDAASSPDPATPEQLYLRITTAVMLVAAVSLALLALRNRMRGRSDGLAGKWSSLLSKLDCDP